MLHTRACGGASDVVARRIEVIALAPPVLRMLPSLSVIVACLSSLTAIRGLQGVTIVTSIVLPVR
jgi:hypothetical protein